MIFGGIGTILTAGYFLWTLQRVNLGVAPDRWKETASLYDIRATEWVAWVPLLVAVLFLGLFPSFILNVTNEAVTALASIFGA